MQYTILADFGSTYTKLCVLDLENGERVMTCRHPSTVKTDASIGLLANLSRAKERIGERGVKNARMLASSSAAGGLRMVVVGLTPRYSLLAGMNVALGAGARVIKSYSFLLREEDIREIETIGPEILLLCGGVENGNMEWTEKNARALAESPNLNAPVIYAGNREIAGGIRTEFLKKGKECYVADNVFPSLNELNAGPSGEVIRQIFMNRITGMKGLGKVRSMIGDIIMPTPAAVLLGGKLLSEGLPGEKGLGNCMIFDVGGATTDVYSYAPNVAGNARRTGSPEPDDKRTVEGDLGLRSSALSLMQSAGAKRLAEALGSDEESIRAACGFRTEHEDYIPDTDWERRLDFELAKNAVRVSARRHGGRIVNAYAKGARRVQEGKNLTEVRTVVGTGGPIINSMDPKEVMRCALKRMDEREILLPQACDFYLDREYLLYAVGLSSTVEAAGALRVAKANLIRL